MYIYIYTFYRNWLIINDCIPIVIHVLIHLGVGSGAYLEIPSKKTRRKTMGTP